MKNQTIAVIPFIPTPTIADIKRRVKNAPHFFDRDAMKFFGQTMRSFSVRKIEVDGETLFRISAPMKANGKVVGYTTRTFNPTTDCFQEDT